MRALDHVSPLSIIANSKALPDPGSPQPWWASGEVAWVVGTAYTVGQYVARPSTGRVYVAVANSTGADPALAIHRDKWRDAYPMNAVAWADMKTSTATRATGFYQVTVAPGSVSDISLDGLVNVESVRVRVIVSGLVIFEESYPTIYWSGDPWVSYFFDMPLQRTRMTIGGLPADANAQIEVRLDAYDSGDLSVSQMAFGRWVDLGCTEYGIEMQLRNFGVFEQDRWGNTTLADGIVPVDLKGSDVVPAEDANRVSDFVRRNRNRSMVWEATSDPFYDYLATTGVAECSVRAEGPSHARLNFSVLGVPA